MLDNMGRKDPPPIEGLPEALRRLADKLGALSADDREPVIRTARRGVSSQSRGVSAAEFATLCGVVNLGGDAVEDCEALHDDP